MIKILFLEDDVLYRDTFTDFLECEGYVVDCCSNGNEFLDKTFQNVYDLYIIDINVPQINGFEVMKMLREYGDETIKLVLTSIPNSAIKSFQNGCDEFINKMCDLDEIKLRIKALIRRSYQTYSDFIVIDDNYCYDIFSKKLYFQTNAVHLTLIETSLLACLLKNRNKYVNVNFIEKTIYPANSNAKKNAIKFHINSLRKIFEGKFIFSEYKKGYAFFIPFQYS
ncbi:MAG: response regulator transcription factor [Epsilonproteobacteria bacterium]|nr:response regulator transcription factor [Campylobacterota bacterium]